MSHFSDIGFHVKDGTELDTLLRDAVTYGKEYAGENCEYRLLSIDPGIEIWVSRVLRTSLEKSEVGFQPHFKGKTKNLVTISQVLVRNPQYPTEGSYTVWANQTDEKVQGGAQEYPYVFDAVDFLLNPAKEGEAVDVQITAFADELKAYDSNEEYMAAEKDLMLAPQAFIPSGMFKTGGETINPPDARAVFSGIVNEVHDLSNSNTKNHFLWLVVDSLDAKYDVVVDPAILNKKPIVGGLVLGSFWLSGKIYR